MLQHADGAAVRFLFPLPQQSGQVTCLGISPEGCTLKNSSYWQLYRELRKRDSSGMESMIVSTSGASTTCGTR